MEPKPEVKRFAERTVRGRDDHGEEEIVTIYKGCGTARLVLAVALPLLG